MIYINQYIDGAIDIVFNFEEDVKTFVDRALKYTDDNGRFLDNIGVEDIEELEYYERHKNGLFYAGFRINLDIECKLYDEGEILGNWELKDIEDKINAAIKAIHCEDIVRAVDLTDVDIEDEDRLNDRYFPTLVDYYMDRDY